MKRDVLLTIQKGGVIFIVNVSIIIMFTNLIHDWLGEIYVWTVAYISALISFGV